VLPWIVLFLGFGATPAVVYATIHGVFPILVLVRAPCATWTAPS